MAKTKALSNSEFVTRVREYLPTDAGIYELDCDGNPHLTPASEIVENDFYLFDAEALIAFNCAIEETALEEANGSFLAAIQDFRQFEPLSERYWQIAATLDDVQVIGTGRTPRKPGNIKFCNCGTSELKKFWLVLYQGDTSKVLFLCEQSNDARAFEEKKFVGFYTFNERVISQAKQDVVELLGGKCPDLKGFGELRGLDRAAKRLKVEFAREQQVLDLAIKDLRGRPTADRTRFLRRLQQSLERLNELKTRLPELIVGHRND